MVQTSFNSSNIQVTYYKTGWLVLEVVKNFVKWLQRALCNYINKEKNQFNSIQSQVSLIYAVTNKQITACEQAASGTSRARSGKGKGARRGLSSDPTRFVSLAILFLTRYPLKDPAHWLTNNYFLLNPSNNCLNVTFAPTELQVYMFLHSSAYLVLKTKLHFTTHSVNNVKLFFY